MKKTNVIESLKALDSGLGNQSEDFLYSFYAIAYNELTTDAEKEAFKEGALCTFAGMGRRPIKRMIHSYKFKQAMRHLGGTQK